MLLPEITAWSLRAAPERYCDVAEAMGLAHAEEIPGTLESLSRELNVPRLGTIVDPGDLRQHARQMAGDAIASGSPANNPRVPTEAEIVALYERCL